ncbi:hypothetical protein HPP92_028095 [Vanilla planifolia]|uniref:Uncharacterized protein n=1 Tax=Vanilla planifolia TaxID=51239 RepID=A0A835P9E0_VANPL|nr:hypothetical protein HPP92_028095 [Vanilla planifolia]
MGRKEKVGDAVNPLDFAGPRSLVELRGARADATKNIDSISSLEPKSMKSLKEVELPDGDRITPGQHAIGDETEAATKDEEPRYSNLTDGGCKAEAGVDYKRKYDITGCMDVDPDEHDEEEENVLEKWMEFKELFLLDEMIKDYSETDIQRLQNQPIRIFRGIKFMSESRQISREATRKFILLSHVYKRAGIHTLVEFHFVSSVWPAREEHSGKLISYKTFTWKKFPKGLSL